MGAKYAVAILACLLLPLGSAYTTEVNVVSGTAWIDCEEGWVALSENETEIINGSDYTVDLSESEITVELSSDAECQVVIPTDPEMPNLRPSPQDQFETKEITLCSQNGYTDYYCQGTYNSGNLTNDSADVFGFNVTDNEIVEVRLVASSADVDVSFHLQTNNTEIMFSEAISTSTNTSIGENIIEYLIPDLAGRIIVTVKSNSPSAYWGINVIRNDLSEFNTITHLDTITGTGPVKLFYPLAEDSSLLVTKSIEKYNPEQEIQINYRYVRQSGTVETTYSAFSGDRIASQDGIVGIELSWNCTCSWQSSFALSRHYDAGSSADAPSAIPTNGDVDNASWPLIIMDGAMYTGQLTLFLDDTSDVLRVETSGWNESIHLVDLIVEGDISKLEITIWDIEQHSWQILDSITATYSMNSIKASLEVGRGTHFIRIAHINGSSASTEEIENIDWQLRVSTAVLDEGEEPWFPPSEKVKTAANWFYWIMGAFMLLPVLIFFRGIKKEKDFAMSLEADLERKRNRLQWLREKLDKGDFVQKDLTKSLKAIASLEWETAIEVWGAPTLRHHTEGIDLAIWALDERLCKGWPILIGINPQERDWEVAAIRFESPEGEQWNVANVEPKLLFREDEVFLDVLSKGSRFFVQIELNGKSNKLDLHLSGMVGDKPMAAKPSKTIYRELLEEE
ncbi:MAG: hypothetical protein QGI21_06130 [Candidatus Poseidoniaceae archaeon]|nr:hypothetical protein [Candidatus Poseidoniaceae archaeon]